MCKIFRFMYIAIPHRDFRSYLIKRHFAGCIRCQRAWEPDSEREKPLAMPEWIHRESSLWPEIQKKIKQARRETVLSRNNEGSTRFLRWQLALTGVGLFILTALIFMFLRDGAIQSGRKDFLSFKNPQIKIVRAEIQGKKAKPFIYKTGELIFIWFAEINQEQE